MRSYFASRCSGVWSSRRSRSALALVCLAVDDIGNGLAAQANAASARSTGALLSPRSGTGSDPIRHATCASYVRSRAQHRPLTVTELVEHEQRVVAHAPKVTVVRRSLLFSMYRCQGRRDIRPRGGAKVYHLSGDVQRECPPATGVVGSPQWQRGRWSLDVGGIAG